MRDLAHDSGSITYLLSLRDGAFALDTLSQLAADPKRPDLSEAEACLVSRNDPLCDMAVAAYGHSPTAVAAVFRRGISPHQRSAALGNQFVRARGWAASVMDLEEAAAVMTSADSASMRALFANRNLTPDALVDVLRRRGPGAHVPMHAYDDIFFALADNPYIGDLVDTRRALPAASSRAEVHVALESLLLTLVPQETSANAVATLLASIYDMRSPACHFESGDLDRLIRHWHPSASSDASGSNLFRVQMLLALLYANSPADVEDIHFASVRAAKVAATTVMDSTELEEMVTADKAAFFAGMPFNRDLYDSPLLGATFVSMASGVDESALAIYLHRRNYFDKLWRLDRPLVFRDLEKFRTTAKPLVTTAPLVTEKVITQSMRDDVEKRRITPSKDGASWRHLAYFAGVVIILLLLYQLAERSGAFTGPS